MYSTAALQNLCLFKVVQELEYYPPEFLVCLPPTLRRLLLVHLPVIDVCQLANTCVFDGINTETIWEQLYHQHTPRYFVSGEIYLSCDVDKTTIEKMHTTFRERYLAILANVILNRARPSGYFENIDYTKFSCMKPTPASFLAKVPVDIVNTLIAGEKIVTVYEKDQDSTQSVADTVIPNLIENSDIRVTALTDYKRKFVGFVQANCVYKKSNELCQYVPPRYATYASGMNHRLSDPNALSLLMKDCEYYPKYLSVTTHDYRHFGLHLLQPFLCCLVSLKLFVDGSYRTLLTIVLSNKTPVLSSLELDTCFLSIDDEELSFLAQLSECPPTLLSFVSPLCTLTELSISNVSSADDLTKLGTVISCQKALASFSLNTCWSNEHTKASRLFVDALVSLFQSPSCESVTLKRVAFCRASLQDLVVAFVTSSCTNPQKLTLESIEIKSDGNSIAHESSQCQLCVSDSASEYKSLEFSGDEFTLSARDSVDGFISWLCSLQPLKLNSLKIFCCVEHVHEDCLPVLAENTSFHVKNLSLFQSRDVSVEAIQKLLKNVTLKSLEIGFYSGVMNFQHIAEYILKPLSSSTLE